MDFEEIQTTDIWELYRRSVDYCRKMRMFLDTDKNYRFYNGNQWEGLKVKGIEPIQYNFIRPIVKYKAGVINANLWAINFSNNNFESSEFRETAKQTCELLNNRASRIWEKDNLDKKIKDVSKDSAINDEGVMYVYWDEDSNMPVNEVLDKTDIFYGNENEQDIQRQPYIIIKKRISVMEAQEYAEREGLSDTEIKYIVGDKDNLEQAGEDAKEEKDDMVTLVTKFYKKNGTVQYAQATKYVDINKDKDTGYSLYPVSHMLWEEKKGSARGEGEVRNLVANQIETNKTAMRRLVTVKNIAYPQRVVNIDMIQNPSALNEVGGLIKVKGGVSVQDIQKVFANIPPAQMSPDVKQLQEELIQSTRELAGAGDSVTGEVDPESASGRAILAVQQAAQQPLTEQVSALKLFIEDIARIWLNMIIVNSREGIQLEKEVTDPSTGEKYFELVPVDQVTLENLKASVKVDITANGSYDKYAKEMTLENLLKGGYFSAQKVNETKAWAESLSDDAVAPKQDILDTCNRIIEEQQRIAQINAQAQMMQQQAMQFLSGDPDAQAEQLLEAQTQGQPMEGQPVEEEVIEDNPDDN